MRLLIFILLFATSAFSQVPPIEPGVSQELAKWRASQYSNISYKLNLTLAKMSPWLKGTIEIRLQQAALSCSECPPMAIILDWRKLIGSDGNRSGISNVSLNGKEVMSSSVFDPNGDDFDPDARPLGEFEAPRPRYYEWKNEHLIFRDGVVAGENVITLDFTTPIMTSGSAITRYVDKEDGAEYIYSLFVPSDASTAFPVFDQPDLKARFELTLNKPPVWEVITNTYYKAKSMCGGFLLEPLTECKVVFSETKPISTYVFAFAAGPFQEFSDTGVSANSVYVRKSQAEKFKPHAAEVFRLNREAVKYLETYFDYKFPWPKYDLVLIPEFPFGGMEHAGATFLREQSVIFPQEPTKNDIVTRANLIFHEAAHQWFGDTVTMKWFDDLWLKEGFATFMAYKALDKIMPEAGAWKVFYERVKQAAYRTDSTRGTTPIYQPIANLSAAKSAYGNIVYNKAPAFLRQAEFYLGEDKFQTAVRAFLKKHEFRNATWQQLVNEFAAADLGDAQRTVFDLGGDKETWARWGYSWVNGRGMSVFHTSIPSESSEAPNPPFVYRLKPDELTMESSDRLYPWVEVQLLAVFDDGTSVLTKKEISPYLSWFDQSYPDKTGVKYIFPNYEDYGYGIFLLDDKSRDYVLKNIQSEKDDFLRTMMWGSLWDSVREAEINPREYVELVIKNIALEKDEGTIQTLLSRVTTAMSYYMSEPPALAGGKNRASDAASQKTTRRVAVTTSMSPANAGGSDLRSRLENLLIDKIENASTQGQRITYYRAFLNIASTDKARGILKQILKAGSGTTKSSNQMTLKTKDKFDIVTRLAILGDPDAAKLLADLEKTETSDDAKRYAYAAHAAFATPENKTKFWNDFINNKTISESWIEAAVGTFNSIKHSELTLPYLEKALGLLPRLKRERKIFFVNDWLADFIGGQRDEKALGLINKFLADNPNLDKDLRLKILENSDLLERAVKIRAKFSK